MKALSSQRGYCIIGIESVKDGDELLPYGEGKKCLVLATEKPEHYESIAFIELTAEGKIQKLTTSTNGRYQFKLKKHLG